MEGCILNVTIPSDCFFNAGASSEFTAENFCRDFKFAAQAVGFFLGYLWTHRGFTQLKEKIWLSSGMNQFNDIPVVIIKVGIG